MVDMALVTPLAMVLATAMAVMARGLLTLRLMPTMAMEDMVDTDSAMEDMVMVDMDMASKQCSQLGCQELPRLMQGTATTNFVSSQKIRVNQSFKNWSIWMRKFVFLKFNVIK